MKIYIYLGTIILILILILISLNSSNNKKYVRKKKKRKSQRDLLIDRLTKRELLDYPDISKNKAKSLAKKRWDWENK